MSTARLRARKLKTEPRAAITRPRTRRASAPPSVLRPRLRWPGMLHACTGGRRHHPFTPVPWIAMPWMKVRWVKKNKTMIGAVAAVAAAITQGQLVV